MVTVWEKSLQCNIFLVALITWTTIRFRFDTEFWDTLYINRSKTHHVCWNRKPIIFIKLINVWAIERNHLFGIFDILYLENEHFIRRKRRLMTAVIYTAESYAPTLFLLYLNYYFTNKKTWEPNHHVYLFSDGETSMNSYENCIKLALVFPVMEKPRIQTLIFT